MTDRRAARALLRRAVSGEWRALSLATVSGVLRQGSLLALPWCVQHALDDGIVPGDTGATLRWAAIACAFAALQFAGLAVWQWQAQMAGARSAARLRDGLTAHVAGLDRAALAGYGHGDLAMRATRDVDQIRMWVFGLPVWAVIGTTLAIVLPAVAGLDPLMLGVTLAMVPLLAVVNIAFPGPYERAGENLSDAHAARADAVEDLLSAGAAVRGIGGGPVLVERHRERSAEVTVMTERLARVHSAWAALGPAVPRIAIAAGVAVGGHAALDGRITVGGLVAFTVWMTIFTLAMTVLVDRLVDRGNAAVAAGRITEILALAPSVADPAEPKEARGTALAAEGVVVRHDGDTVLGPCDLAAGPGEFVAVTGPTGCGKSTLLRLLARLDDPAEGAVLLGGTDVRDVALAELRSRVAYVPQRPLVLSGTVAHNLCPGREATPAELRAACETARVHAEIEAMPEGYATELGEGGSTLSGGQVQRLALARALLTGAEVLLLDDVTSALDPDTERLVVAELRERVPRPTIVFVSHRQGVLAAADRVVDLAGDTAPASDGSEADLETTPTGGASWRK
ncbi:ABC transporter ATP-binding protein [Actinocorallia libanotica]|uniref:ATP-binding cassette subfamily B protein n=1 Tax=Actinocorallia libanotica TaxID=46162 RepID=A0ABP4AX33_9ACTN